MRVRSGFTLVEILIAMTLISLLASAALASYQSSRRSGRDTKRRGDLVALQQAFEQYYLSNQTYATPCSTMATGYLQGSFPAETLVGWNAYAQNCTATTYCVCARLEGGGGGNASNSTCTFGTGEYFCVANQQ